MKYVILEYLNFSEEEYQKERAERAFLASQLPKGRVIVEQYVDKTLRGKVLSIHDTPNDLYAQLQKTKADNNFEKCYFFLSVADAHTMKIGDEVDHLSSTLGISFEPSAEKPE